MVPVKDCPYHHCDHGTILGERHWSLWKTVLTITVTMEQFWVKDHGPCERLSLPSLWPWNNSGWKTLVPVKDCPYHHCDHGTILGERPWSLWKTVLTITVTMEQFWVKDISPCERLSLPSLWPWNNSGWKTLVPVKDCPYHHCDHGTILGERHWSLWKTVLTITVTMEQFWVKDTGPCERLSLPSLWPWNNSGWKTLVPVKDCPYHHCDHGTILGERHWSLWKTVLTITVTMEQFWVKDISPCERLSLPSLWPWNNSGWKTLVPVKDCPYHHCDHGTILGERHWSLWKTVLTITVTMEQFWVKDTGPCERLSLPSLWPWNNSGWKTLVPVKDCPYHHCDHGTILGERH